MQLIGLGYYMRSYSGNLDFYFQMAHELHTTTHRRIVVYASDPNVWFRGERRYYGLCGQPTWRRPAFVRKE